MRAVPSLFLAVAASGSLLVSPASGQAFKFNTGSPDGKIAMATNPSSAANVERETGDDFVLTSPTTITGATFTGLITGTNASIGDVVTEIYRVFPEDSGPFDNKVPTRTNSPSDVAFRSRDSASNDFTFTTAVIDPTFTAAKSVLFGIDPNNLHTGGEPAVTGQEVEFSIKFSNPLTLPADHYFFVPQVDITGGVDDHFFWLSAPKPISGVGTTPFPPGFTDLQTWIRDEPLQPDWLRVGTDIVGGNPAPTFNAAFSLSGAEVPESSPGWIIAAALAIGVFVVRRRRRLAA
jgi:hypothetical protein